MKSSPTQRSLAMLREMGYLVAVVEKFVRFPPPGHRVDLFGFGDLLAVKPGFPPLLVQTTTGSNAAARVAKIHASKEFQILFRAGWDVVVHGWRKGGPRGARKVWSVTETRP